MSDRTAELIDAMDEYLTSDGTEFKHEYEAKLKIALKTRNLEYKKWSFLNNQSEKPITIMFTDIVNYSKIAEDNGDLFAQRIVQLHNIIVRSAIKKYNGIEIKHIGDGILSSFNLSSNGTQAAIEIQQELYDHNKNYPAMPIHIRIGINVGEVLLADGEIYGSSINLASRVCNAAGPDRIFVTGIVKSRCENENQLFCFQDKGKYVIKGFSDPIPLYKVLWNGEETDHILPPDDLVRLIVKKATKAPGNNH